VRFVYNPDMRRTAGALIEAWGLTGFIGFDFIVDSQESAWLIECNPRPVSISHMGARVGEDLCRALHRQLTGQPPLAMRQNRDLIVAHFRGNRCAIPPART